MPVKEKIIKELQKGPVKFKTLKSKFKGSKKFFTAVNELYDKGLIDEINGLVVLKSEKKKDKKNKKSDNLNGTVVKLTENYGFVRVESLEKDVFVAGKFMMGSVVGDEVELKKIPSKRHDFEGEIVSITKEKKNIPAYIEKDRGYYYAVMKDTPVLALPIENKRKNFKEGDLVLIDVYGRGRSHRNLTAKIRENMGVVDTSEKAVSLLISQKQVSAVFPEDVLKEADEVVNRVDMAAEYKHRKDLTDKIIFTIDSASTKDIDDAISVEKLENGYKLGVHIADVSHFVKPASYLNKEAFERGTSIYFGDNVIPMLPKQLSNNACSLNPMEERLAFTCDMTLDINGNVTQYKFYKSIIKSRLKGVYSEINSILDNTADNQIKEKYREVMESINTAMELYSKLWEKRQQRGAMNIESDESYIVFDENHTAVDIMKRQRGESEKMIEEFMLLANGCSANLARKANLPFVYRIHSQPDAEKLFTLKENLKRLGLRLEANKNETMQTAFSKLLDKTRGTSLQQFVHSAVLRSQSKAKYYWEPEGHFGLSLEDYAHFTSPIRRYPDLAIHRILTDFVYGVSKDKINKKYSKFAQAASEQSSKKELSAMEIERDADDIYKAEYMQKHIGEVFEGSISGLTNFGIYVALENTVEGLVHISVTDLVNPILQEGFCIYCPITGKKYTIGDKVKVKVLGSDILNGNIDFEFAN